MDFCSLLIYYYLLSDGRKPFFFKDFNWCRRHLLGLIKLYIRRALSNSVFWLANIQSSSAKLWYQAELAAILLPSSSIAFVYIRKGRKIKVAYWLRYMWYSMWRHFCLKRRPLIGSKPCGIFQNVNKGSDEEEGLDLGDILSFSSIW